MIEESYEKEFTALIGRRINSVSIDDEKQTIVFTTDKGPVVYSAYGDCCSHSWFEHLTGTDVLAGEIVNKVVNRPMPESNEIDSETIRYYGWTLETSKGRFDIEMRNSSNGYYGGSVHVGETVPNDIKVVTADF